MQNTPESGRVRPVVALMGEFSAGKSTLANLLIGEGLSPVRVTATQLPPVWYSYGDGGAECVDYNGEVTPLDLDAIDQVSVEETAFVRVFLTVDVLELMDIIDMPGISDPNLSARTWQQVIPFANCVIWCSHATQAWRQSEAATWSELPASLYASSLLLLTRFDKILTEDDRRRVMSRVEAETDGLFAGVYPVSLLQAACAEDDRNAWEDSGAEAFSQKLLDIVFNLDSATSQGLLAQQIGAEGEAAATDEASTAGAADAAHQNGQVASVTPRRIVPRSQRTGQRERLPRSALNALA